MKLILYVKDDVLLVVQPSKGSVHLPERVDWKNEDELEKFVSGLSKSVSLQIIFDFIDENLQYEWVPKLLPWEKGAYEKRLISKAKTNGGLFVHCQWLPIFQKSGSRNEQLVLVASILKSPALVQFLELLEAHQLSVTHLYSHAFLLQTLFFKQLAPRLKIANKQLKMPLMLVVREDTFRFRQLFFLAGELRISRSVTLDDELESEPLIYQQLKREIQVAIKYLYNQKLLAYRLPLSFVYLSLLSEAEADLVSYYQQTIADSSWQAGTWFAKQGCFAELLKLSASSDDGVEIHALSELALKHHPASFYHWDYVRKHRLLALSRAILTVSWVGVVIFGLALLIAQAVQFYWLSEKQSLFDEQKIHLISEKQRLQSDIKLPYDAEDVKATVEFSELIIASQTRKLAGLDMVRLSEIVALHPHILVDSLHWQKVNKLDSPAVMAELKGWVFPFDQSYQQPVEWVDHFVAALHRLGNVEVTLTQEPLDRNLQKSLQVEGESVQLVKALPFMITLQWHGQSQSQQDGQ
ncbi:MAG: hypothetical protein CO158_09685 [Piscirickettsiaceae bacterium CG_4_9_14_3_um_filter_43_564]|nr:hypothetical protein [Thiomicrospira sp.]OIP96778.1 MAG: hypothetical protein AUK56_00765 [Thiomicrospira sp. CG2_30_44_34]PIQ04672.1 MAG: hypothetical protein COW74_04220 [Piscirickettsiaceae bacterium CG18_big_fil_WC_8_21_14_2_50_44_103]PIU39390.1 MAG: hypothetical protein COT01_01910 [Piscirickettsiaceae bacterium CG07_land_8_20_14_0_80_44_28]PIW56771.1 MAG: hypothetical protein COW14_09845 [Piscirickettsiaceae bacterium CG12_big_fil_rev_8_21_14_0_65_44_934]PIW77773.1 MAG: hypothetical p